MLVQPVCVCGFLRARPSSPHRSQLKPIRRRRAIRRSLRLQSPSRSRRKSGSTRPPTSPASRRRPPTTCWSRSRLHDPDRRHERRGLGQASENVLINGQRIANKIGRRGRPAPAHLGVERRADRDRRCREPRHRRPVGAGREHHPEGQTHKASGQFEWNAQLPRAFHQAGAARRLGQLFGQGRAGRLHLFGQERLRARRPRRADRDLRSQPTSSSKRRNEVYHSEYEEANIQAKFGIDGPGSSVGNLTLGYTPYWNPSSHPRHAGRGRRRDAAAGPTSSSSPATMRDINGDYEFALGPGRLKLIGVRHWEHEPLVTTQILRFRHQRADPIGTRFSRDTPFGETIGRGEYHLEERARTTGRFRSSARSTRSTRRARLFELDPRRRLRRGAVSRRAPARSPRSATKASRRFSRPLASNLDLQVAGGRGNLEARPRPTTTSRRANSSGPRAASRSAGARRRTGTSASSFAAASARSASTTSSPSRSSARTARMPATPISSRRRAGKSRPNSPTTSAAGARPGSTSIITGSTDIVDVIPIGDRRAGRRQPAARRPRRRREHQHDHFDPIGWTGAKLDLNVGGEWTSVKDPLTGEKRPISGIQDHWGSAAAPPRHPGHAVRVGRLRPVPALREELLS